MTQDTKQYELSYLLAPSVPADEVEAKLQGLKAMIEKHEGALLGEDAARLRPLAYEIRKSVANKIVRYTQAYAGSIYFTAPSVRIPEVTALLRGNDLIVRFLLVQFTPVPEAAVREEGAVVPSSGPEVSVVADEVSAQSPEELNQKIDAEIDNLIAANS